MAGVMDLFEHAARRAEAEFRSETAPPTVDIAALVRLAEVPGLTGFAERLRVAEDALSEAGWPPGRPSPFGALCPSEVLAGKSLEVYRAHVRELVARAKAGEPMGTATDAETLCAFIHAAGLAPLHGSANAAVARLARNVFGDERVLEIWGTLDHGHEAYTGRADDFTADVRKRLYAPWRDEAWPVRRD